VRLAIFEATCCSCEPEAEDPLCVRAVEIDCRSVDWETPCVWAIELRLSPDSSSCWRLVVLKPRVPETELSMLSQLL